MTPKTIQLVLDEEAQTTLAKLQTKTRALSLAEVLRDALGVYNALYEILENTGAELTLLHRSSGELQPLLIPSLTQPRTQAVVGVKVRPS